MSQEKDKLIALFMGRAGKENPNLYWVNVPGEQWVELGQMRFQTSWEWLMPVVDKISDIYNEHPQYHYFNAGDAVVALQDALFCADIQKAYECVIGLIEYLNCNVREKGQKISEADKTKAIKLWDSLGDIPVDEDEQIEEPFEHFPIGTHREDIWHWFEETFLLSVAKDLMFKSKKS